ncbi:hypothetical protein H4R18_004412 [Coemansia javaensis]|uniref:HAD family hydrolase n=1 Tax=Coemansia javaensis TaxID=2761396 RepID=A0A9W8HBQ9_9FUNG|nr:hypothetical protein H4R18_004412 [Coemansia javaensis]
MVYYAPSTREAAAADPAARRIRGVVFDMDGTLTVPITEYLRQMRRELQVPDGVRILDYIDMRLEGERRAWAHRRVLEIEAEAMQGMELSPGLVALLQFLHANDVRTAIITRNNRAALDHFVNNVVARQPPEHRPFFSFDPLLDRSFAPTKPAPDGLLHISRQWGIAPEHLMMVGDHGDDLLCGIRAGSVAALLRYSDNRAFEPKAHVVVDRIDGLVAVLAAGFEADMAIDGDDTVGV